MMYGRVRKDSQIWSMLKGLSVQGLGCFLCFWGLGFSVHDLGSEMKSSLSLAASLVA